MSSDRFPKNSCWPENLIPSNLAPSFSRCAGGPSITVMLGKGSRTLGSDPDLTPREVNVAVMVRARIDATGETVRQFHRGVALAYLDDHPAPAFSGDISSMPSKKPSRLVAQCAGVEAPGSCDRPREGSADGRGACPYR